MKANLKQKEPETLKILNLVPTLDVVAAATQSEINK